MPAKQFEGHRNYSMEVLLVSDGDIPEITGQPETVIALTQSLVQHGARVAKRYVDVCRLDDDIFEMPTYQGLRAKIAEIDVLLDDSNRREIGLASQIEGIKKKYAAEMDTLDKAQHEIRMLKEVQAQLDAANKTNREQAKQMVDDFKEISILESKLRSRDAKLQHLQSQSWWQLLFERGCGGGKDG